MIPALPDLFRSVPIAHRALHDRAAGRPENSRAAITAAIDAGYGIEIDLQLSADGQALVFHDYDLSRLAGKQGAIRQITAAEAAVIPLAGGDGECIPTLSEILDLVAGRTHLLIELKDQDGAMGPDVGPLERATADALQGYEGPVAVMSFNPHSITQMARLAPDIARGLTTSAWDSAREPVPRTTCERLREIPDFDSSGAAFISHDAKDLERPRVQALRAGGTPVLCWTIRNAKAEAQARHHADNITFEGYAAALTA